MSRHRRWTPRLSTRACAVLALTATCLVIGVTAAAWTDCAVVATRSSALLTVAVVAPGVFLVLLGLATAVAHLVPRRWPAAAVVLVVLGVAVAAALMYLATPAGYADPVCVANVPPWWPAWLPS